MRLVSASQPFNLRVDVIERPLQDDAMPVVFGVLDISYDSRPGENQAGFT